MKVTIYHKTKDDLVRDEAENTMVFLDQTHAVNHLKSLFYTDFEIKEFFVLFNRCKPLIPEEQGGLIMSDSFGVDSPTPQGMCDLKTQEKIEPQEQGEDELWEEVKTLIDDWSNGGMIKLSDVLSRLQSKYTITRKG